MLNVFIYQIHIQKACGPDNLCRSNLQMRAQFTDENQRPLPMWVNSSPLLFLWLSDQVKIRQQTLELLSKEYLRNDFLSLDYWILKGIMIGEFECLPSLSFLGSHHLIVIQVLVSVIGDTNRVRNLMINNWVRQLYGQELGITAPPPIMTVLTSGAKLIP